MAVSMKLSIIMICIGILIAFARSLPQEHKDWVLHIPYIGFPLYLFVFKGSFPPHISPRCHDPDKERDWLRSGDVVVSVPGKSGTTWTMQTVHAIRTKGRYADYDALLAEVPWMELRHHPGQSWEDQVKYAKKFFNGFNDTFYKYRVFKAHEGVPVLKFHDDVKYVVVVRKPIEIISSMILFLQSFNPKFHKFWGMPAFKFETESDLSWIFMSGGMIETSICGFVNGWWPHINKPNVLASHYTKLLEMDQRERVKMFAKFLGESLTDEEVSLVVEQSSIEWMKKNEDKMIGNRMMKPLKDLGLIPLDLEETISKGGLVNKGGSQNSKDFKLKFPTLEKRIDDMVHSCVKDKNALNWLYNIND